MLTAMADPKSTSLFERAEHVIPGGVNSPVRAFRAVGGAPSSSRAPRAPDLFGADGREYIDYVGSWGPAILGHAHPDVVARRASARPSSGLSFGAPTELEVRFAETVDASSTRRSHKLRCVSSGTEATMSAIRVARGFTKRDVIVKFEGCYHGHADHLLVKAGSGARDVRRPRLGGRPGAHRRRPRSRSRTTTSPALEELFADARQRDRRGHRRAGRRQHGLRPARAGLPRAHHRRSAGEHGAALDLRRGDDRLPPRAAAARRSASASRPDMTCLGKIIGGGMPLAAYGGRDDVMNVDRAARPGLPGRHAQREPGRRDRRARDARASRRPSSTRTSSDSARRSRRASRAPSPRRSVPALRAARRLDDHALLPRAARCGRGPTRPRATRSASPLARGPARARRLLAPVAVRGGVRERGARPRRQSRARSRPRWPRSNRRLIR